MTLEDLLESHPCALLGAIAEFVSIAGENDAPVVRELLRPLLQPSPVVAAFLAEFEGSDRLADLLEEVRREEL